MLTRKSQSQLAPDDQAKLDIESAIAATAATTGAGGNGYDPPRPPAKVEVAPDEPSRASGRLVNLPKNPFADMEGLRRRNKALLGDGGNIDTLSVVYGPPPKDKFFKCPEGDEWYMDAQVWTDAEDRRKSYYIDEDLWQLPDFEGALQHVFCAPWMTRDGSLGLWGITRGSFGGGDWEESSMGAVQRARQGWRRMHSDNNEKRRRDFPPYETIPDRPWPADLTPQRLYEKAFGSRLVTDEDHPLIRRLRGLPEK
jgi:hypothetical protein